jgi:hypothetical protein
MSCSDFNEFGSPFAVRERVRMRKIKSNTFVDYFDPLTPALSRREREKRQCLSRKDSNLGEVPKKRKYVRRDVVMTSVP